MLPYRNESGITHISVYIRDLKAVTFKRDNCRYNVPIVLAAKVLFMISDISPYPFHG